MDWSVTRVNRSLRSRIRRVQGNMRYRGRTPKDQSSGSRCGVPGCSRYSKDLDEFPRILSAADDPTGSPISSRACNILVTTSGGEVLLMPGASGRCCRSSCRGCRGSPNVCGWKCTARTLNRAMFQCSISFVVAQCTGRSAISIGSLPDCAAAPRSAINSVNDEFGCFRN